MTLRRALTIAGVALVALVVGALMYWRLPGWASRATSPRRLRT